MKLQELNFTYAYLELDPIFWQKVSPSPLRSPFLISANLAAFDLIGLDYDVVDDAEFVRFLNGELLLGEQSYAMCYAGHQFGHYVSRLGDGRAINLGKVGNYYLQLKGAGKTRYSRGGDGRAVLRSSIREYLMSEAMHGLGIATTRALAIIGSKERVLREHSETGAMVLRLSTSWVRFGTFEYFYYKKEHQKLLELADFVIVESYAHLQNEQDRYYLLFAEVLDRTARLMAQWQSVGFNHGVMNTDNFSIEGMTIDYGPFAFLDDYDSEYICNHTDMYGRYSFGNQPYIGHWNLVKLAQAFSPLVNFDRLKSLLDSYGTRYRKYYTDLMRQKLGLFTECEEDESLIEDLLALMQEQRVIDYTWFFRTLSEGMTMRDTLLAHFVHRAPIQAWLQRYDARIKGEGIDTTLREFRMQRVNPKFVLKNYMLQEAIVLAQKGDYSLVNALMEIARQPFSEHSKYAHYSQPTPKQYKNLQLSCSS